MKYLVFEVIQECEKKRVNIIQSTFACGIATVKLHFNTQTTSS